MNKNVTFILVFNLSFAGLKFLIGVSIYNKKKNSREIIEETDSSITTNKINNNELHSNAIIDLIILPSIEIKLNNWNWIM
jgi:hypothetical protein